MYGSRLLIRCTVLWKYLSYLQSLVHHTQVLLKIWIAFCNMTKSAHEKFTRTIFTITPMLPLLVMTFSGLLSINVYNDQNRVTISLIPIAFWADGSPEKNSQKTREEVVELWMRGWGGEGDRSLPGRALWQSVLLIGDVQEIKLACLHILPLDANEWFRRRKARQKCIY